MNYDVTQVAVVSPDPFLVSIVIFVLAMFVGFEVITKVPSTLHTPLMSGSNAISGITIVGALMLFKDQCPLSEWFSLPFGLSFGVLLGFLAVIFATINVVGGYFVTNRMLEMFKKRG